MPNNLSAKQKLILQIVKDYRRKHGYSPTLGELKKLLGVQYVTSVVHLLGKLEEKGYIQKAVGAERGITPVDQNQLTINIPVVGSAPCGKPLLAQENIEGYIPVDKNLLRDDPTKYFFLKAVGDSMDRAGIENGDMVLVHSQPTSQPGDKVIALIDNEATIKIFKPSREYIALVPKSSNPENKPIILHQDFTIQGIVRAVYKKDMLWA